AWPVRLVSHVVREDDLVADERACRRRAWNWEEPRTGAGAEAAAHARELHDAETFHEILEREILTERHEMNLVVNREHAATVVDREQTVIDAPRGKRALCVPFLDEPCG